MTQGYRDIGAILEEARVEQRLSVGDIATALHIRPRYIVALEEGNMDAMPGLPYARGYLTRYAAYLSLDRVEMLRRFEMASGLSESSFFLPHSFSFEKRGDPRIALMSLATFLFCLVIWLLWIRPDQTPPPLVEPVPGKVALAPLPPPVQADTRATCLRAENSLYPPCYWPKPIPQPSIMTIVTP